MSATIDELLLAAEYVLRGGNDQVMLCERGIRTFEPRSRGTLDLNAIPILKRATHLPVIVDPSHAAGVWWMVTDLAWAAVAAGADGLLIEVHVDPEAALSDGAQSLTPATFAALIDRIVPVAHAVGRGVAGVAPRAAGVGCTA
jgi:3-deoxy-7-phosphoheptulonate synthase